VTRTHTLTSNLRLSYNSGRYMAFCTILNYKITYQEDATGFDIKKF